MWLENPFGLANEMASKTQRTRAPHQRGIQREITRSPKYPHFGRLLNADPNRNTRDAPEGFCRGWRSDPAQHDLSKSRTVLNGREASELIVKGHFA